MKYMAVILLNLCIFLHTGYLSRVNGWRGIVPLHSTRADVERLLGPGTEPEGISVIYKLEHEVVHIQYSSGLCIKDRRGGWNVPRDTVVGIIIGPKKELRLSDLQLDEKSFKKSLSGDATSFVEYVNREKGVSYSVHEPSGTVAAIYYEPMEKDKHLRCPTSTDKHR